MILIKKNLEKNIIKLDKKIPNTNDLVKKQLIMLQKLPILKTKYLILLVQLEKLIVTQKLGKSKRNN